jgi:putative transposase
MEVKRLSHAVYHCDYHLVICTKYRKKIFNEGVFAYFKLKLAEVVEHYPYLEFKTVNHDVDHLHLLVSIPPTIGVGRVVGIIKQNTSLELRQKFPFIKQAYGAGVAVWSEGYFASTVGINERIIEHYIENQGKTDAGQTKFELT